ncbi:hypothetical protein HWD35_16505 [Tsukamurella tyrosinosolvens]|uniref:DUF202 domain-containing protein n=1 Tax=Tsukamurella tyrosinosolvens TaxID=57704 RepID=UPI000797C40F|nr:DUF202 domain-containing protein [Tsukamurella tyrosinosolvens]AUN39045.1 hypothetical protein ASU32_02660 [Tsukamurella tyrosinosolvens]KXP02303.1 hypothetical protein AXK59_17300 [Tsukamurella tyrosinosolvens]MCA4996320.1 hypothetical protein [Tsukamurella tyrosinosolvens]
MSGAAGAPSTQAAERTLLAHVRTAVALVLTCAIVARAALDVRPAAAPVCLVVAVAAVVTLRTRPPLSHLVLTVAVVALAAVGVLTAVR